LISLILEESKNCDDFFLISDQMINSKSKIKKYGNDQEFWISKKYDLILIRDLSEI
jgi:hypothetical protein